MRGFSDAVRKGGGAALLLAALGAGGARAADVNSPIIVPLQPVPYEAIAVNANGYKYGIMASFGGSTTPQLFEFDTGASGVYAAYGTNPNQGTVSTWWGPNVGQQGRSYTQVYTSGNTYQGFAVPTSFSLFGLNGGPPIFSTASAEYNVGQTNSITIVQPNNQLPTQVWPGFAPPVDGAFYGDFGVGPDQGNHTIANPLAQLTYAPGLAAGFIVATGPYGATSGAYVQIGLAAADLANPRTTWFTMQPGNGSLFPFSNLPAYDSAALIGSMALNGQSPGFLQNVPLVLDTGAPTTDIFYNSGDTSQVNLINAFMADPQNIALTATTIGQQSFPLLAYPIIANGQTTNAVNKHASSAVKVNTGATLFQTFVVTYDFTHGQVGLTPYDVPEPSALALLGLGLAGLGAARARRG